MFAAALRPVASLVVGMSSMRLCFDGDASDARFGALSTGWCVAPAVAKWVRRNAAAALGVYSAELLGEGGLLISREVLNFVVIFGNFVGNGGRIAMVTRALA
jgi:hypothetical protein